MSLDPEKYIVPNGAPVLDKQPTKSSLYGPSNIADSIDHIAQTDIHFTMLDEDDFASNSTTQAATQQSIKAHVAEAVSAVKVNQVAHGFAVQDPVYYDGINWLHAKADDEATLGVGIVSLVIDANNFRVTTDGEVTELSGLIPGEWYYVSDSTAGILTTIESSIFSNPILYAISETRGIVLSLRASEGPSAKYIDAEIDGGFSNSVYLASQHISGGGA